MTSRGGEAKPFGTAAIAALGNIGAAAPKLSRKTRAKLERGDSPRSGQPVWRNSYTEGQCERYVWRRYGDGSARTGKRMAALMVRSAKRSERDTRLMRQQRAEKCRRMTPEERERELRQGKEEVLHHARRGLLGEVGIDVLEFLWNRVDYLTGRLEPAIETIADEIGRSYSAVHIALKRLRDHGWLEWERRSRPIDEPREGGPLVEQISNAYALLIPEGLKRYVSMMFGTLEEPDCLKWDREQRKAEEERMLRSLSAREYHRATWFGGHKEGETLARIAQMIDNRESSITRETGGGYNPP